MTTLWRDRYKLATVILATALLVGLVFWSGIFQSVGAWWNSYEVWYYHANYRNAPLVDGYRSINTKGGISYDSDHLFECRVTEEFYQAADKANYNWTLSLPANRCREILP